MTVELHTVVSINRWGPEFRPPPQYYNPCIKGMPRKMPLISGGFLTVAEWRQYQGYEAATSRCTRYLHGPFGQGCRAKDSDFVL